MLHRVHDYVMPLRARGSGNW